MSGRFRDRWRAGEPPFYTALVEFFEGDRDRADAWLVAWLDYAGDAATAEQLLTALEALGPPDVALVVNKQVPALLEATTPSGELDSPAYFTTPLEVPAGPLPTPVEIGSF